MSWIDSPKISNIRPYLKIMRFDNLTGKFLLLWPCLISIGFASDDVIPVMLMLKFIIGCIIMRSAGCITNDIIDRKIDAKVERTKNRPLANGDMKLYEAIFLLMLLLSLGALILFTLPSTVVLLGTIVVIPIFVYPFMKRITYWPQVFLAMTFNWGALMGWAAVKDSINLTGVLIYTACIFWTIGYDTIYAHQDKNDDAALGIKSTALKLGVHTRKYLYFFYLTTTILFWIVGILTGSGILFHLFLIIGLIHLYWQANTVDFNVRSDCMAKFSSNRYYGMIIFIGVMLGKIAL
ncbi:MAG: 4-hydroxybenzoate octaprenyltransferase [Alphaproteobacteria bacterium CG11_big_fil_rev_8_21_14_0_20_39_49]|nr:MAG: 4-hydroxybenzoate octaprenyltransferase [Alphaproteobacteria bacterium CG11_big_fil_rev_8_21_14_0_20_39_49]